MDILARHNIHELDIASEKAQNKEHKATWYNLEWQSPPE